MLGPLMRSTLAVLGAVGLFCSSAAPGQELAVPDLTGMSIEDLSQVRLSTASRHLDDPRKAPVAVTVITADEISRYGWRTLADLLPSVTGFYTAYDRSYSYVGVRGFLQSGDYNARVLLLIDGHRINDDIYDGALIGTEFPLDLDLIDRVEVARGPGSSLFGTNAELAVVNVLTRRPSHQDDLEITSDASSFYGRTGEVRASFRTAKLAALVSASAYRSNGAHRLFFPEYNSPDTDNGIATNLDGDRYDHAFGTVRLGQLRLEGLFGKRDKIVPNAPYQTIFADPGSRTIDTVGYFDASYSRDLSSTTQIDLRAYYDAYRFWGSYPYIGNDGVSRTVQINDAAADTLGLETVVGRKIGRHRIVGGGAVEHSFRINQRNYYVGQPPFLNDHRALDHDALFGEAELNASPRFSLNIGGRLDWYSLYGHNFSPRIAAMYFPTASTSLKYIFGQAFRAPDPYDEFYVDNVDITGTNKALEPEYIDAHTVLLEHAFNARLHASATAFMNDLNHVIREQEDAQGNTHFMNGSGDKSRGAELELIADDRSGWMGRASYTYARTREHSGAALMNSPTQLAKLNGSVPVASAGFWGTELLFTGSQSNFQSQRIASSLVVNTTISSRTFAHGLQASASCYNLLGRKWATPTGPEVESPATVQDGRTWRFRLTYRTRERR